MWRFLPQSRDGFGRTLVDEGAKGRRQNERLCETEAFGVKLRQKTLGRTFAVVAAILMTVGCSSSDVSLNDEAIADLKSTMTKVERPGLRYVRKLAAADYANVPDEMLGESKTKKSSSPTPPLLDSMSRQELAEALRGIVLAPDGSEYMEEAPNWRVADLIIASRERVKESLEPTPGRGIDDEAPEELQGHAVYGTDSRSRVTSSHLYPHSAHGWFVGGNCTGVLIGPSTMLTAAHCTHDGTNWRSQRDIEFGVNSQKSPRTAFPRQTCYVRTIPSGWVGNNHVDLDYAVFEFNAWGCTGTPGNATGWLGIWAAQDGHIDASPYFYSYGYPADSDPDYGGISCPGGTCYRPSVWGTSSNWKGVKSANEIKHKVDTHGGQSGSGVYVIDGGDRYVIGIHKGQTWDLFHGGYHNHGRRVNSALLTNIESWSQGNWSRDGAAHKHPWHP